MPLSVDAFRKATEARQPGPRCAVAVLLQKLIPKDRTALNAALDDNSITGIAIAEVLTADGHRIGASSITRHRGRGCACGPR